MKKQKKFRRVKVSNRGYVSGKRLQVFRAYEKKTPASAANAGGGKVEKIKTTVSTSYDTKETEDLQA